jgi:hypothetical protein
MPKNTTTYNGPVGSTGDVNGGNNKFSTGNTTTTTQSFHAPVAVVGTVAGTRNQVTAGDIHNNTGNNNAEATPLLHPPRTPGAPPPAPPPPTFLEQLDQIKPFILFLTAMIGLVLVLVKFAPTHEPKPE